MHAVGLCLIVGAVVFWLSTQSTPRFVALRGANALYGGGSISGLSFHPDELRELGLSQKEAADILESIREHYLPNARIVSDPEFRQQVGRDVLSFQVEVSPGVTVRSVVEVIGENGQGILMFGDLVASYRATLYRVDAVGAAKEQNFAALNGIRKILIDAGVEGYWDITRNRLDPWPEYTLTGQPAQVAQS